MRLLKAEGHRRMPWKNGGGETTEIAVHPEGADLERFDWRVSMARVAASGPFSRFEGVDRTLAILDGEGMDLDVGGAHRRLDADTAPLLFPADVSTTARLLNGPVADLNVMTRRQRWRHDVRRVNVVRHATLDLAAAAAVVLCCRDGLRLDLGASRFELHRHDALLFDEPSCRVSVVASAAALLYVILLNRVGPAPT